MTCTCKVSRTSHKRFQADRIFRAVGNCLKIEKEKKNLCKVFASVKARVQTQDVGWLLLFSLVVGASVKGPGVVCGDGGIDF